MKKLNFTLTESNVIETIKLLFSLIAVDNIEMFPLSMQDIYVVKCAYSKLKKYISQKT